MPLFRELLGQSKPLTARDLEIKKCGIHDACLLNALWHSRFPRIEWSNVVRNRDYICFVAEFNAVQYAVAIWSSPIAANRLNGGSSILELRRFAISDECPKNTASRMLSVMRRHIQKAMPHISKLISYQDTECHSGTIYKASGWTAAGVSEGESWTNKSRSRNKEQSVAPKVRWELIMKD